MIKDYIQKVSHGADLTFEEASLAMDLIMDGKVTPAQIAGLIIALKVKGEKVDEVAGFVHSMRKHSLKVPVNGNNVVDGCGTGGDGSHTFNVSTAASLVAAGAGAKVAKHGNRSVSSQCGSADILEKAGATLELPPEKVADNIDKVNFAFLFAPHYHPSMKYAAGPRRELGVRTIFNILGPMTNPASVKSQLIGVFSPPLMELMADVLRLTGSVHVITAHSRDGLDEFSVSAPTDYIELKNGELTRQTLTPAEVGLTVHSRYALAGGDADENLSILNQVLDGAQNAYRDAVILNAGVMLYLAGLADNIKDGVGLSADAIDKGRAKRNFHQWIKATNK